MQQGQDARQSTLPPAARLEQAAVRLSELGDHRTLIAMVERWSQLGDPTPRALLVQIRSLIELCLMDRAWTRIQALPDDPALQRDRMLVTARMFRDRGWPRRARKVLEEARQTWPDDPELRALSASMDRSPFSNSAADPDPDAPFSVQLACAESWLATGAFLKARRLLESLARRYPDQARPADLLWALRGDFELHGTSLQALVKAHAPLPAVAGEGPQSELTSPLVERRTPPVSVNALPLPAMDDGVLTDAHGDFGSLGPELTEDDGEVTQATRLDDLDEVARPDRGEERDEDTQVLRIVASSSAHRGPASHDRNAPEPNTSPGIADELEGEDEAVVLLTRHAERQPPQRTNAPARAPDLGPRKQPSFNDPPPPPPRPTPAPETPPPPPVEEDPAIPTWFWVAVAGLGGAGVALGLIALWLSFGG